MIAHSSSVLYSVRGGGQILVVAAMRVLALVVHGRESPLCRKEYFLRDTSCYEILMSSVARIGGKEHRAQLNNLVLVGATYHVTHICSSCIRISYIGRSVLEATTIGENNELQSAM